MKLGPKLGEITISAMESRLIWGGLELMERAMPEDHPEKPWVKKLAGEVFRNMEHFPGVFSEAPGLLEYMARQMPGELGELLKEVVKNLNNGEKK